MKFAFFSFTTFFSLISVKSCPEEFSLTGACDLATVKAAASQAGDCDLANALDVSEEELEAEVEGVCDEALRTHTRNFTYATLSGDNSNNFQWDNNYFDGGTKWNDEKETETESLFSGDSGSILRTFQDYATSSIISWPDYHPESYYTDNFKNCDLRAAMCCFIDSRLTTPLEPNADVCNHNLHDSKQSNHINRGFAVFEERKDKAYCNAFAWSDDDKSMSSRYAGNALFYISMYSGLYESGFVENIPSSPLCGCIEQMAMVDDTECTKVDASETYNFKLSGTDLSATMSSEVSFSSCDSDFVDHYKTVATPEEAVTLQSKHIVNECADENMDFINNNLFYIPGPRPEYLEGYSGWTLVVGEGQMHYPPIGDTAFRALIEASPHQIIWRKCLYCDNSHKEIFYKRITELPPAEEVDFLDLFMNNWENEPANLLNVDFELYSSYEDALAGVDKWEKCNYGDEGVGFPRDCGPTSLRGSNWNSYVRSGGKAWSHAFYVEKGVASTA